MKFSSSVDTKIFTSNYNNTEEHIIFAANECEAAAKIAFMSMNIKQMEDVHVWLENAEFWSNTAFNCSRSHNVVKYT